MQQRQQKKKTKTRKKKSTNASNANASNLSTDLESSIFDEASVVQVSVNDKDYQDGRLDLEDGVIGNSIPSATGFGGNSPNSGNNDVLNFSDGLEPLDPVEVCSWYWYTAFELWCAESILRGIMVS